MERKNIKNQMIKTALIFGVTYILVWLGSGLIVHAVDSLNEYFTGAKYVDGWTPVFMVWTASLYIIPIIFLLVMLAVYLKAKEEY